MDIGAVDTGSRSDSLVDSDDMLGLTASKLTFGSLTLVLLVVLATISPKSKSAKLPLNPSCGGCIIVALCPSSNSLVKLRLRGW